MTRDGGLGQGLSLMDLWWLSKKHIVMVPFQEKLMLIFEGNGLLTITFQFILGY